ncbi:formin-like protein 18, partial [Trichoplusia ni]|uniref:Formin-like protein 18 n=1 Tax=Trichoplusia ni TaxID=7111 RepID=A0A7E5VX25_TRINI
VRRQTSGASRGSIMLKFLTHKLRTHSLNEESVSEKVEERDSGTESDDEADRAEPGDFCTDVIMKWNDVTDISMGGEACACAPTPPRLLPDPEPDHLYDHHSSEEELEVINGAPSGAGAGAEAGAGAGAAESRRRGASSPPPAAPEKRKWPAQPYLDPDTDELAARAPSSDDDDTKVETPVRFRTSPPLEALKPRRAGAVCSCAGSGGAAGGGRAAAERAPLSPRRRRLPLPPPRRHRPALDFDKMQQLKVGGGGVRSWRAVGGAHGGELSVFCW